MTTAGVIARSVHVVQPRARLVALGVPATFQGSSTWKGFNFAGLGIADCELTPAQYSTISGTVSLLNEGPGDAWICAIRVVEQEGGRFR